jgi:hypothetical protein
MGRLFDSKMNNNDGMRRWLAKKLANIRNISGKQRTQGLNENYSKLNQRQALEAALPCLAASD